MGRTAMQEQPNQRHEEIRALNRIAFDELGRGPKGIGEIHRAIAGRAFRGARRGVGPAARPVQVMHDAIAEGVYGALRGTTELLGRGVDAALRGHPIDGPPLSVTSAGSFVLGALQGVNRGNGRGLEIPDARVDRSEIATENLKQRPELVLHFLLPLRGQAGGGNNERPLGLAPLHQRLPDHPGQL